MNKDGSVKNGWIQILNKDRSVKIGWIQTLNNYRTSNLIRRCWKENKVPNSSGQFLKDFSGINLEAGKSLYHLISVQGLDPEIGEIHVQLRRKTVGIYNSDCCTVQTIAPLILESRYGK